MAEPVSTNAATMVITQLVFDELAHCNYSYLYAVAFGSIVHVNGYAVWVHWELKYLTEVN